jgi:membrane fusion protein
MADATGLTLPAARRNGAPAPDRQPLFRAEVMAERQTQWLGTVLLEPKFTQSIYTWIAVMAGAAVFALLLFGSYTRKAHVNGWLVPQQGLARIVAPQAGVVTRIDVREGMAVDKGAPLLTLSAELRSDARGDTREEVVLKLKSRRDNLANARSVLESQLTRKPSISNGASKFSVRG